MLRWNALPAVHHIDACEPVVTTGSHSQRSSGFHRIARIQKKIQENLLQFPRISFHPSEGLFKVQLDLDVGFLKLMFDQIEGLLNHAIDVYFHEFRWRGSGKAEQRIHDFAGAESLLGDLIQQLRFLIVTGDLLGQHLRVRRDHGQRRIHFVRHSSGQKSDRT